MKLIFIIFFTFSYLFSYDVTVSIAPIKYFLKHIAKDKLSVNVVLKGAYSPHSYEPKLADMQALYRSKIFFYIGVPYEKFWLNKFKFNESKILFIDLSEGIEKISIKGHNHKAFKHEEELDPHIWLSPSLAKKISKNILKALIKVDKKNTLFYEKNYEKLIKKISNLDLKIRALLKDINENSFVVFHPSWAYFARDYKLRQIAIEKDGKEPKAKDLSLLIKKLKNTKFIFVSPNFSTKMAGLLAKELNAKLSYLDPLKEEWDENLIYFAKKLREKN